MDERIAIALYSSVTGLLGVYIGHRLNLGRERRQMIREFRRLLGNWRSGFERQPAENIFELYNISVPKIRGSVSALKGDLCCGYQKLRRAADTLTGIPLQEIEKPVAGGFGVEFETGRKRILDAIDALEKAI